ncbi:pyridoxamine 5'-phosphate oxidase family protein [Desulfovibrio aminophilus]|nr:pyridoxamine 5'-phosphate oxidase family protein [Desulfovibrio aminophilus]MCM0756863.1 pyridoxamine 5'-phosphate oxidase family protein [Desulfovibrio aminophilus]
MRTSVRRDPALVTDILDRAEVLHLALVDEDGPYCVAVNFALEGRTIFFHSGKEGRKARALGTGAPVAFAAEVDLEIKRGERACQWGWRFRSVQGRGTPRLVEEPGEKRRGLGLIMRKYAGSDDFPYDEKILAQTAVVAVDIEDATARLKGYER